MCCAARKNRVLPTTRRPIALFDRLLNCILPVVLATTAVAATAQTVPPSEEYQYVIEQARAGRHAWALDWLERQSIQHPQDLRIKHDQLIVAGWAGRYQDAMRLHQTLPPNAPPLPPAALAAAARAYRDAHQWPMALTLYREGKRRYPNDDMFTLGELLVLADSGEANKALSMAGPLTVRTPRDPRAYLVQSYAFRLNQQAYAALGAASTAYSLAPNNPSVLDEYLHALSEAGLAEAALRVAREKATLVSAQRLRSLEEDRAAELTRLASRPSRQEAQRFNVADRALDAYQQLGDDTPSSEPDLPAPNLRTRIDQLIALHSRARMSEVVKEYESLKNDGVEVPHYALGHVASAYLDLQQPENAAKLYLEILNAERAIQADPSVRLSHQSGLFYAFIEAEQFGQAQNVISGAVQEQPIWQHRKGTPLPQPNELSVAANQQAALAHHYADDTLQAQASLEQLVARAPGHSGLRGALAEVYLARGWPRRAEQELKLAETHTPLAIEVVSEQAKTALRLQEWRQAEVLIQNVASRFPENSQVKRLERDWERHNRAELRVSAQRGLASDSPVAGSGDLRVDTVLYTPPVDYNWRGFAGVGYAKADFDDYEGHNHWYRAGAEWRSRGLTAELEASSSHYGQGAKVGLSAQAAYDLNDQWQIGAQAAFRSLETPLKALANDINSNRLDTYIRWRESERREWRFTFSPSRFSDGNRRLEAAITGRERLYTAPHLKLDALLDISASHNTAQDAPYFNPRSDFAILPALSLTHTLHRRYDNVLEQRFMVGAGLYTQRDYGSGAIAALGYGVRYRFNDMLDAGVSITGISRPYDGQREREARVMFDLKIRF